MSSISHQQQKINYREAVLKYAEKHSVRKAAAKYEVSPRTIYRWRRKWYAGNKDPKVLVNDSRRPHSHPNAHTEVETTLIKNLLRRNPRIGLQDLWLKAKKRGYTRTIQGLAKLIKRLKLKTNSQAIPSPTCKKPKPFEDITHPGARVQIDVKFVPFECMSGDFIRANYSERVYQYTAQDMYSRVRIIEGYSSHDTYTSADFLRKVVSFFKAHGVVVECVQTDNGAEFTSRILRKDEEHKSQFELMASALNVKLKHIKTAHSQTQRKSRKKSSRGPENVLF